MTTTTTALTDAADALRYDSHNTYPPELSSLAHKAGLHVDPVAVAVAYAGCEVTTASAAYLCGEILVGLLGNNAASLDQLVWEGLVRPIPPTLSELGCDHEFNPDIWPEAHRAFVTNAATGLGLDAGVELDELVGNIAAHLAGMTERISRDRHPSSW